MTLSTTLFKIYEPCLCLWPVGTPPAHLFLHLSAQRACIISDLAIATVQGLCVGVQMSPAQFWIFLPGLTGTWHCVVQYESEASTHKHLCSQQHSQNLVHFRNACGIGQGPMGVKVPFGEQSSDILPTRAACWLPWADVELELYKLQL